MEKFKGQVGFGPMVMFYWFKTSHIQFWHNLPTDWKNGIRIPVFSPFIYFIYTRYDIPSWLEKVTMEQWPSSESLTLLRFPEVFPDSEGRKFFLIVITYIIYVQICITPDYIATSALIVQSHDDRGVLALIII